jgi:formylglycine-generating enzyme required for sulfatase activity
LISGKPVVLVFVAVVAMLGGTAGYYLWERRVPAVDGMIYYPGGAFPFGKDNKATNLGPFYIDEAEVSNALFAGYCNAQKLTDATCAEARSAPADLPVVNVTIEQARAYAKSVGKRMPNAREWERAARGVDALLYPWGAVEDASYANVSDNPTLKQHALMPVRSYKKYPHYQMAGNVWEMLDDLQIRGGSYLTPLAEAKTYQYRTIRETDSAPDVGFRCAKSFP